MVLRELSPRVLELIRQAARIALKANTAWLEQYDHATPAATVFPTTSGPRALEPSSPRALDPDNPRIVDDVRTGYR